MNKNIERDWIKVAGLDELPDGRVMSAKAGVRTAALFYFDGQYAAMDNRCRRQLYLSNISDPDLI